MLPCTYTGMRENVRKQTNKSLVFNSCFQLYSPPGRIIILFYFFLQIRAINENSVNAEEFGEVSDQNAKYFNHIKSKTSSFKDQRECVQAVLESGDVVSYRNNVKQRIRVWTRISGQVWIQILTLTCTDSVTLSWSRV